MMDDKLKYFYFYQMQNNPRPSVDFNNGTFLSTYLTLNYEASRQIPNNLDK